MLAVDLHSHSTVSDGVLTPSALIDHVATRGGQLFALTDHDHTAGAEAAQQAAVAHGIMFVPGVEISVTWEMQSIHIVGLRIDPAHSGLQQALLGLRSGRFSRAQAMADGLAKVGIEEALAGALRFVTNPEMISRTHFARYLVAQGIAKDIQQVFRRFMVPGKPGYVPHQWADLAEAVAWIVAAGGDAVLAHPGRYRLGRCAMRRLLMAFKAAGGVAIEVISGNQPLLQNYHFAQLATRYGLLASLGSDFHASAKGYCEPGRLNHLPQECIPLWSRWRGYEHLGQ